MPWTERQVRYLLSDASPLTAEQKAKMRAELHANPEMGRKQKGKPWNERTASEKHQRKLKRGEFKPGGYNWRDYE